jgi:hypothetical protein
VPWFRSARGRDQDSDQTRNWNQPRTFITNTEEYSHGEEEENGKEVNDRGASLVLGAAPIRSFRFREVFAISPSG